MICPYCHARRCAVLKTTPVAPGLSLRDHECGHCGRAFSSRDVAVDIPDAMPGQPPATAGNPPQLAGGVGGALPSGPDPIRFPSDLSSNPDQTRARVERPAARAKEVRRARPRPAAAAKRAVAPDPHCGFHRDTRNWSRASLAPLATCPGCKHARAAAGTRKSEPSKFSLAAVWPELTDEERRDIAAMRKAKP